MTSFGKALHIVLLLPLVVLVPGCFILRQDSLAQGCGVNFAEFIQGPVDVHRAVLTAMG